MTDVLIYIHAFTSAENKKGDGNTWKLSSWNSVQIIRNKDYLI